jgi:hypothetical protein
MSRTFENNSWTLNSDLLHLHKPKSRRCQGHMQNPLLRTGWELNLMIKQYPSAYQSLRKTIKASAVRTANLLHKHCAVTFSAYRSLGTVTRLWDGWMRIQGSNLDRYKSFFTPPSCWDWLWGPPSLLFNGYWRLFPQYASS